MSTEVVEKSGSSTQHAQHAQHAQHPRVVLPPDCGMSSKLDPYYFPLTLIKRPVEEIEFLMSRYMLTLGECPKCKMEIHTGGHSSGCEHEYCLECIYEVISESLRPVCPTEGCNATYTQITYRDHIPVAPIKRKSGASGGPSRMASRFGETEAKIYGLWEQTLKLNELDGDSPEDEEEMDDRITEGLTNFTRRVPKSYMNNLNAVLSQRDELLLRYHPYNFLGGDASMADISLCITMVSKAKAGLMIATGLDENIKDWMKRLTKRDQICLALGLARVTIEYRRRMYLVIDELESQGFPNAFDRDVVVAAVRKYFEPWTVSGETELIINSINLARKVEVDPLDLYGETTVEDVREREKIDEFFKRRRDGHGVNLDSRQDRAAMLQEMEEYLEEERKKDERDPSIVVENEECTIAEAD